MITVYLYHLDKPLSPDHTAQHYLGSCEDGRVMERMREHKTGRGARFTQVANERHIRYWLVRVWPGGRKEERRLKNQNNAPRLCPICSVRRGHVAF